MDSLTAALVSIINSAGPQVTVTPLTLASNMVTLAVSESGAPGLAIISIHQSAASVLDILVGEGEHTVGS